MILQLEKIRERSLPRASPPAGDVAHEHPRGVGRRSIPGAASLVQQAGAAGATDGLPYIKRCGLSDEAAV
jgi:hypothetical protein